MTEIKYYVHGSARYLTPSHMWSCRMPTALAQLRAQATAAMEAAGANHAVYAVHAHRPSDDGPLSMGRNR